MLRQEAKISEQLKSIEIDRLKRLGKAIRAANQNREYCTMCDLVRVLNSCYKFY